MAASSRHSTKRQAACPSKHIRGSAFVSMVGLVGLDRPILFQGVWASRHPLKRIDVGETPTLLDERLAPSNIQNSTFKILTSAYASGPTPIFLPFFPNIQSPITNFSSTLLTRHSPLPFFPNN